MNITSFKAKVRPNGKTYHISRKTDCKGLFVTICNPGLTRATSELHDVTGNETLCKVCRLHQGGMNL